MLRLPAVGADNFFMRAIPFHDQRRRARALGLVLALVACVVGPALDASAGRRTRRKAAAVAEQAESAAEQAQSTATAARVAEADALITRLSSPDERREARSELLALGTDAVTAFLARRTDPDFTVRWEFANVLGDLRDPRALEPLAENVLHDESAHVRWRSLWALSRYAEPQRVGALDVLRAGLVAGDPAAAWNAAVGLAYFGQADGLALLYQGLASSDDVTAWEAVDALGHVHDDTTVAKLMASLPGLPPRAQHELALSLGHLGTPAAVAALRRLAGEPDPGIRWRACLGLLDALGAEAAPDLEKLVASDEDPDVMAQCGQALERAERMQRLGR